MDEVSKQETLRWRVKVYLLNEGGNWDEGGTGDIHLVRDKVNGEEIDFFQVVAVENDPTPITVSFEKLQKLKSYRENENYVLYRPLLAFNVYEKQGGTFYMENGLIF